MDQIGWRSNRKTLPTKEKERLLEESSKPTVVRTENDIKLLLRNLLQYDGSETVNVSAEMSWSNDNKQEKTTVKSPSNSMTLHKMLIDGMNVVKKHLDAYGKIKEYIDRAKEEDETILTSNVGWDGTNVRFNVDTLIEKELGGKRIGTRVRWTIAEGIYEYDPLANKLFRVNPNGS